jgi:hypothetical protein
MALEISYVNLGTYPNDGFGDDLRTAFEKSNASFKSLEENVVLSAINLGNGSPVWVDKVGNDLRFRSFKSPDNPDIKEKLTIGYDSEHLVFSSIAIADLIEDVSPELGGDLNLNTFNINGSGNILINGDIEADLITANTRFLGNLIGDVISFGLSTFQNIDINGGSIDNTVIGFINPTAIFGTEITATSRFFGGLTGDVLGDITSTGISTFQDIRTTGGEINSTLIGNINPSAITGTTITATNNFVGTLFGDVLGDITSIGLSTFENIDINGGEINSTLIGNINPSAITGTTITATNNFVGSLTGQVSSIENHSLEDLNNVSNISPTTGQVLSWNGTSWTPSTRVSRIIAGNNITISPTNGEGEVTINSTGGSGIPEGFDFGNITPSNMFELLVQATPIDFGGFTTPSSLNLDLGFILDEPLPPPDPTYSLTSNVLTVDEGSVVIITLTTTDVSNGTVIPYQITGVSSSDINGTSLTGSFVILNNSATLNIPVNTDLIEENETLTLTLVGILPSTFISIDINDFEIPEDFDGGGPSTVIFDVDVDGGDPSQIGIEFILDGGVIEGIGLLPPILDGGSPFSIPTVILDGESPSTPITVIIDAENIL